MFCQLAIVKRLGAAGAVCASAVLCAGATDDTATVRLRVFEHDGERAHGLQIVLEHPHAWRMPEMYATVQNGLAVFSNVPVAQGCTVARPVMAGAGGKGVMVALQAGRTSVAALVLPPHGTLRVVARGGMLAGHDIRQFAAGYTPAGRGGGSRHAQPFQPLATNEITLTHLPAGRYGVSAQFNAIGLAETSIMIRTRRVTLVDGTPHVPVWALTGAVVDARGHDVAGTVYVRGARSAMEEVYGQFTGTYVVAPLVQGENYRVRLATSSTNVYIDAPGPPGTAQVITLPAAYRVSVRFSGMDGPPGAVTLGHQQGHYSSDDDVVTFEQVLPGTYTLKYGGTNRVPSVWRVAVTDHDVDLGTIALGEQASVEGRLVAEAGAVHDFDEIRAEIRAAGTNIVLRTVPVRPDADGRFTLRGIPIGTELALKRITAGHGVRLASAGPFEAAGHDLGDVRITSPVAQRQLGAVITVVMAVLGCVLVIPFVLYVLALRVWFRRGAPVRWSVWDAVAAVVFFLLGSVMLGAVAFSLTSQPGQVENTAMHIDMSAMMWALLAVNLLTCGYIALIGWARRGRLGALLPCARVPWRRAAAWIVLGTVGTQAFSIGYSMLLRWCGISVPMQEVMQMILGLTRVRDVALTLAVGVVLVPVAEELLYRGVLFGALHARVKLWLAVTISALVFAAVHIELAYFIPVAVLGAVSALSYARTKSIAVPIGLHILNNLAACTYVMLELALIG